MKSVFVATPAYGGQITVEYARSQVMTMLYFFRNKMQFGWIFVANESLVNRARNRCVTAFLETDLSHLLFIDADMGWTDQDLDYLLSHDVPVVGGTYPVKTLPVSLNFNYYARDDEFFPDAHRSVEDFTRWKEARADENGLADVFHAPTGFMLIERSVFDVLRPRAQRYTYRFGPESDSEEYNWFPIEVKGDQLLSEDWAFCGRCHDADIPIYLDTRVVTSHTGAYAFTADSPHKESER